MELIITPPEYILSKLQVKSLDEIKEDEKAIVIEETFKPAEEYQLLLHSEKIKYIQQLFNS